MARATVTGALLAGGASRRMGRDKRLLAIDGEPMARRAAMALAKASDELLVVVSPQQPLDADLFTGLTPAPRMVEDRRSDAGPLAGLEAALGAARHDVVLVVAADMPWLAPALLTHLAERLCHASAETDAVAAATRRGPEPMLAAYRRGTLPTVTALLDAGERRMGSALAALRVEALPPDEWRRLDPTGRSVLNVNRAADLARGA